MEKTLTFDQLPEAVTMLTKEVSELKHLLIEKQEQPTPEPEKLLTVQETAEFLNPTCSFYPLKTTKYPQNNKISTNFTVFKNLYS